jgi:hypothetical protein
MLLSGDKAEPPLLVFGDQFVMALGYPEEVVHLLDVGALDALAAGQGFEGVPEGGSQRQSFAEQKIHGLWIRLPQAKELARAA